MIPLLLLIFNILTYHFGIYSDCINAISFRSKVIPPVWLFVQIQKLMKYLYGVFPLTEPIKLDIDILGGTSQMHMIGLHIKLYDLAAQTFHIHSDRLL